MSATTKYSEDEIEKIIQDFLRRARYEGYLESPQWAEKRKRKLMEVDYTCEECGYKKGMSEDYVPLDVHHLTYERLGDELMSDLKVLCRWCHRIEHKRKF